jgi:hypothetical protein
VDRYVSSSYANWLRNETLMGNQLDMRLLCNYFAVLTRRQRAQHYVIKWD